MVSQRGSAIKKSWIALAVVPILILSLSPTVLSANLLISKTIDSSGLIIIQTDSQNLTPMFQGGGVCEWGDYNLHGGIYYGDLIPSHQLAHKDDNVTHNGHSSIRLDGPRTSYNWGREINHNWIKVKPGDHIVFRAYIKTEDCNYGWGGSIGVDLYSSNGRLWEVHKREPQSGIWNLPHTGVFVTVPYNRDWTLYTLEFDIPITPFTRTDDGTPINPPAYVAGLIPWLGASHNNDNTDNGSVWFADAEFYINP